MPSFLGLPIVVVITYLMTDWLGQPSVLSHQFNQNSTLPKTPVEQNCDPLLMFDYFIGEHQQGAPVSKPNEDRHDSEIAEGGIVHGEEGEGTITSN